jgi:hypothetical protein
MKFFISSTFTDRLKDEFWDDQKKGWSYPWLKTNWVLIKSMETGGASIPATKYRVDYKEGIVYWLGGGQPRNISIEVESKKSFLGLRRKSILFGLLAAAVLGLMYWVATPIVKNGKTSDVSKMVDSLKNKVVQLDGQLDTSLLQLATANNERDSLYSMMELLQNDNASALLKSIDSLKRKISELERENSRQKTNYRAQLSSLSKEKTRLEAELATLKNTPVEKNDFPGFTARVMCDAATRATYYNRIATACNKVNISATDLGVASPPNKVGTICYGADKDGKRAAQYMKEQLEALGLPIRIEACGGQVGQKQLNIYID